LLGLAFTSMPVKGWFCKGSVAASRGASPGNNCHDELKTRLPTIATAATVYAKQEPQPKCCATVTNLFTYGF
jgi:hypothetical protein